MKLLVVEGNNEEIWREREACGGMPYHKRFQAMLKILMPVAEVDVAFPADGDSKLLTAEELSKYDGVLWTGSSLYVNDPIPEVQCQLTFAEDVYSSGVPFYGSCWGLQIATVVAGGQVSTCRKGLEIGITQLIELTQAGNNHSYFQGRKEKYHALCIHLDEVVKLPKNTTVLARNEHSEIQALIIKHKNSEFFGVQYHPEFMVSDMVFIAKRMSKKLVEEKVFKSENDVWNFAKSLEVDKDIPADISNYLLHTQEVKSWLDHL